MVDINIPAVATGAFFGLLGLIALIACVPPVTRFLGDLCCCPWHIPFTKRRRRNADEELDKDDLPYVAGPPSPRAHSPVDDAGYHRVSAAYMSAVNVVDPELAKEEMSRSREYRREGSPYRNQQHRPQSEDYYYQQQQRRSDYYQHPHTSAGSGIHLQAPGPDAPPPSVPRGWRGSSRSPERSRRRRSNYPPHAHAGPYEGGDDGYGPEWEEGYYDPYAHGGAAAAGGGGGYVDVQRPQHAYSPPEMSTHHGHDGAEYHDGYFPRRGGGYDEGYYGGGNGNSDSNLAYEHSSEYLVGPRQHPHHQV